MKHTSESSHVLVIGSGIAGLFFALRAAAHSTVTIITKKKRADSSTNYAQGGIAAALDENDSFESHIDDTLIAGAGLCRRDVVELVVREGPDRVRELVELGVQFTRENGKFEFGREGGHSFNRIMHVKDATGREIERALVQQVERNKSIRVLENHAAIDFILERTPAGWRCAGVAALDEDKSERRNFYAGAVLLCTGGAGQTYLHTTNPPIATGDGIAMAYRAGARIANMEFIQFHPTALYARETQNRVFLISEAVRGYGGVLRTADGTLFMRDYDERAELAPRDIVARAIDAEMKKRGEECMWLDVRSLDPATTKKRFPTIYKHCLRQGIDMTTDMIPVVPAAHYTCGGVVTDVFGQTSLESLYACGEVACTGLHGANRLASNSLLEAIVFAARAATHVNTKALKKTLQIPTVQRSQPKSRTAANNRVIFAGVDITHNRKMLRQVMWDYVGIVRNDASLKRARREVGSIQKEVERMFNLSPLNAEVIELRNLVQTALLIVECAMRRKESRGLQYTTDYPRRDDRHWLRETIMYKRIRKNEA